MGGQLYVNLALPFGLRSTPKIFTAMADALQFVLQENGVHQIMHYLDDFLLLEHQVHRSVARLCS